MAAKLYVRMSAKSKELRNDRHGCSSKKKKSASAYVRWRDREYKMPYGKPFSSLKRLLVGRGYGLVKEFSTSRAH